MTSSVFGVSSFTYFYSAAGSKVNKSSSVTSIYSMGFLTPRAVLISSKTLCEKYKGSLTMYPEWIKAA